MADTQNTIYGLDFSRNIMPLAQQEKSKMYDPVMKVQVEGKRFSQDQIDAWTMQQKNGRAPSTPENDPLFARRWADVLDYHDNRIIGREDQLKILSDPQSAMTQSAAKSVGRRIDDTVHAFALGSAYYGETGSSSIALPSAQKIADGGYGMTFLKARQAKQKLDDNDVETEDRYLVISPEEESDLLNISQATSTDYVSRPVIDQGRVIFWMGFKIIVSTRLSETSNVRSCYAFQRWGLCLGEAGGAFVRTSERDDKSYMWQVYYAISHGGVRLDDRRVVQIDTYHA